MLKLLKLLPGLVLFSVLSSFAHADEIGFDRVIKNKEINCGYIIAPPYIDKDVNTGKMSGINYEMIEAIGKNLGLKINWTMEVGVGDVPAALSANKIDVMCLALWPSAARYSGVTFANRPEFYSAVYAIVRADDNRFDGDLFKANNKKIKAVAIEGDASVDMIREKLPNAEHVYISGAGGVSDYLMQLTTKKADILFLYKGSLTDYAKENPNKVKIVPGIPPTRVYGQHLSVKLGEYKLRDMLDMATLQLVNDGVFEAIVNRYRNDYDMDIYASQSDIKKPYKN